MNLQLDGTIQGRKAEETTDTYVLYFAESAAHGEGDNIGKYFINLIYLKGIFKL